MSELIALAFDDPHRAEQARLDILKLEHKDLADLEEAVILVFDRNGKARFSHSERFSLPVALSGGFVGTLIGLILINPAIALIGGLTGTALGVVIGALEEVGIGEDFMKDLARNLQPGSSALFVVVRRGKPEYLIEKLRPYKGKILRTSLSHHEESKLREALKTVNESHGERVTTHG
jgi:uncharacterized membrane protein